MKTAIRIGLAAIGLVLVGVLLLGGIPAAVARSGDRLPYEQPDGGLPSSAPGGMRQAGDAAAEPEAAEAEAYLRIAGSALRPRDGDAEWASGAQGGCVFVSSGNGQVTFNVPLTLPQGSTVTRLRMYVDDTSIESCIGWFTAYTWTGDIAHEWGVQSNTEAGETWFDVEIPGHLVDYASYSYVLNWRPQDTGADMQLCGFRVFYHPPGALKYMPEVTREK